MRCQILRLDSSSSIQRTLLHNIPTITYVCLKMHFTPTIVAAVGILASTASAGRISLYSFSTGCTGNSYNCNVGPGFCCVDATQRYTGAVLSQAPGKTLGYFVPDPGGNRCGNRKGTNPAGACGSLGGHRGGITGAKILRNGRRSVEEREEEGECVVPDSVTLGDGTTLKVNCKSLKSIDVVFKE